MMPGSRLRRLNLPKPTPCNGIVMSKSRRPTSPIGSRKRASKEMHSSKWTAVDPIRKEKHFVVRRVFDRRGEPSPEICVEIESVMTKGVRIISLEELLDDSCWQRGWV